MAKKARSEIRNLSVVVKRFYLLFIVLISIAAQAVPAYRGGTIRTCADGTEKTVFLHGDAFFHYMTDSTGTWLDERTLQPLNVAQREARTHHGRQRQQARRVQQAKQLGGELNIAPRGLLIMVNFTDLAFVTPHDTVDSMLNGVNFTRKYSYKMNNWNVQIKSSGSARQYFYDQSYGQYEPVFDVVGPYTLKHDLAYYGSDNDANVGEMIKEACVLANQDGADFTLYDNDNDGNVDFVYVLYAGYAEAEGASEETIWPHNSNLQYYGINCRVDGKTVGNYACSNELSYITGQYNGIGTFCHEFSHVLGLPDLYETNTPRQGLHTLYQWDILDYGCYNNYSNTPCAYSSYERFYMGWLTPRILRDPEYITLKPLNQNEGEALLISTLFSTHNLDGTNPVPSTFYMLECRNKSGWDAYLPGRGLLITKIQYNAYKWMYNNVNNDADDFGVDILEAKENNSSSAASTDAYPAGAKEWTTYAFHEITDISLQLSDGSVRFSYRGAEKPEAVESVSENNTPCTKVMRDGQIVIIRDGKEYTILGNRL